MTDLWAHHKVIFLRFFPITIIKKLYNTTKLPRSIQKSNYRFPANHGFKSGIKKFKMERKKFRHMRNGVGFVRGLGRGMFEGWGQKKTNNNRKRPTVVVSSQLLNVSRYPCDSNAEPLCVYHSTDGVSMNKKLLYFFFASVIV